ncbi:MAG: DNA primase, partial [Limnobacter sp.]|nr:DNA primase [Limnobacter sp.]
MIPQSFIDDLLFRADIVDVVGQYVQLKNAGANLQGLCPFHKEKSPSFSVSASKQFYHCFGCGAHGNSISFLMEHLGLTFPEAVEALAGRMGIEVPYEKGTEIPAEEKSEREQMNQLMFAAAKLYKDNLKASPQAIEYLKSRGLTGQVAARYQLGYAKDDYQGLAAIAHDYSENPLLDKVGLTKQSDQGRRYDRFRDRVMFPIRNGKGHVIGFGGRVLAQGEPKYLNSPETPLFSKGQEIYGLFEGRQAIHSMGYCLVTEGYMDVVALAQWGFENAVATLGTAVTADHVQKLVKQTRRIVFAFDGDKAGRKAAWRALEACLPHVNETISAGFVFLPAEHDPDSFIRTEGAEGFEAAVRSCMPLSGFLLQHLKDLYALGSVEGNSAAIAFLRPLMAQIQPSAFRHGLVQELSQALDQTPVELLNLLGLAKRRPSKGDPWAGMGYGKKAPYRKNEMGGKSSGTAPRSPAQSPLVNLAARLVKAPNQVDLCLPLVDLLGGEEDASSETYSFLHLVDKIRSDPHLIEARLHHAFNGSVHQEWVNQVLLHSKTLADSLDFETELGDCVYQCCKQ